MKESITMSMSHYEAVAIAEGTVEPDDDDHLIKAWQHLVDSGLAWQLQGWFGRTAMALIANGTLQSPVRH